MAIAKFRTGLDPAENDRVSKETGIDFTREVVDPETGEVRRVPELSLTVQSQKEEADINVIVARARFTGEAPQNIRMPLQGDFTEVGDFRQCLHAVRQAQESFDALPARTRNRFDNDPAKFVDFCLDPANLAEARELGLAVPAPEAPASPPAPPPPA